MRDSRRWRSGAALVVLSSLVLMSCVTSSPPPAPVVERGQPPPDKLLHHIASTGETLYSIAWKYELDAQQLAQINGLQPPYAVRPGQRLSLDVGGRPGGFGSAAGQYGAVAPSGGVKVAPVQGGGLVVEDVPIQTAKAQPPAQPAQPSLPPPVSAPPIPATPTGGGDWLWPVKGQVSREFDANNALKGISIFTPSQAPVLAAANGVVVYAGDGLRGYGKLIIVKHSETQLSAYAHNHQILVSENQAVKQGQQIAEVGTDNTGKHRLYFEIRENGKPVDPLNRLPK